MKLTGWTRLWIVASLIWWAVGAWWLTVNFEPETVVVEPAVFAAPLPPPVYDQNKEIAESLRRSLEPRRPPTKEEIEKLAEAFENAPPVPAQRPVTSFDELKPAVTREDWTRWLIALGVVIGAPLLLGAAFIGLRGVATWIWHGFRPSADNP